MSSTETIARIRSRWSNHLQHYRAIAVIRTDSLWLSHTLACLAIEAGFGLIEITWNSGEAADTIRQLRNETMHQPCLIGTGTVLTPEALASAITAGAEFCFTPHVCPALIEQAIAAELPMIPGAFSPTEIICAWQAGASAVKVFPVKSLGGMDYIQALQGPLGEIPLIPTGGVTLDNALDFIQAGAIAVGLSGQLFPPDLVAAENWPAIQARLTKLQQMLVP